MTYTEGEEEWPLCKGEMMNRNHTSCQEEGESGKRVMKCQIGRKMRKKADPQTVREAIDVGDEEECVDMVKLKKENHEAEDCSFHPKTVCKQAEGETCRKVKKKMCNYKEE